MDNLLPSSQLLPREEFRYSNYPEVATLEPKMNTFFDYVDTVNSAVVAYQDNVTDKIYLNTAELQNKLNLSYEITDVLGRASNVCFDLLMTIRYMQEMLNDILFVSLSEGNTYVSPGEPPDASEDEGEMF